MTKAEKIYEKVMSGNADHNITFLDLRHLIIILGFRERIQGDHHFMSKSGIEERINIQPLGNKAKSYQVKQLREIIKKYKLEV